MININLAVLVEEEKARLVIEVKFEPKLPNEKSFAGDYPVVNEKGMSSDINWR
jgi:hypothetical protein